MNKEWSELNKTIQTEIKKSNTFQMGIDTLFDLRNQLMQVLTSFPEELSDEEFCAIPFINANGYHSKTIAYSIWHTFAHFHKSNHERLIRQFKEEQLFTKAGNGDITSEKFLSLLGYENPQKWQVN